MTPFYSISSTNFEWSELSGGRLIIFGMFIFSWVLAGIFGWLAYAELGIDSRFDGRGPGKETPIYYQPSDRYPQSAPMLVFLLVFILSSISGVIMSWLFTERGLLSGFNILLFVVVFFLMFILNSRATALIIRKLKIRSPEMAFKVGLIAASLGWVLFHSATRYIVAKEADSSFLEFIYMRAVNGYPAQMSVGGHIGGGGGFTVHFTAKWFVGIPIWLFELLMAPWLFSLFLKIEAARPFSEKTGTWHRGFTAPCGIVSPPKHEVCRRLKQGEVDLLLTIQPDKYLKNNEYSGWGRVTLFIPKANDGDDYYFTVNDQVMGSRLVSRSNKDKELRSYFKIDYETVVSMVYRFRFDQEKKYAGLLQKLKIGVEELPR